MSRHACHTCDVLKEIYGLKAGRFVVAARSSPSLAGGRKPNQEELKALREDAMGALRTFLRHVNSCYGFSVDNAA